MRARIVCLILTLGMGGAAVAGRPAPQRDRSRLAKTAYAILESHCAKCHGKGVAVGGFSYANRKAMSAKGQIKPGDPKRSRLYVRAVLSPDNPMPPKSRNNPVGAEDATILNEWIAAGAPEPPVHRGKTLTNPQDGAEMIYIPPGDFLMGDDDDAIKDFTLGVRNNPRRKIRLSGYYIYKNVVTVGQYKKFCMETSRELPRRPNFDPNWSRDDFPIVNVSWDEAMAYCEWASKGGAKVTLPTEAQWEKAARGTDGRKFPWGNDFDAGELWSSKSEVADAMGTAPAGRYANSPYELSDMAGNVWQWCLDYYDPNFWKSPDASRGDPVNAKPSEFRSLRGGSWCGNYANYFRCSGRSRDDQADRDANYGFRCVSRP